MELFFKVHESHENPERKKSFDISIYKIKSSGELDAAIKRIREFFEVNS